MLVTKALSVIYVSESLDALKMHCGNNIAMQIKKKTWKILNIAILGRKYASILTQVKIGLDDFDLDWNNIWQGVSTLYLK